MVYPVHDTGKVATPGGDLLGCLLDVLLTFCNGILKAISFTIYKTGDHTAKLDILYFSGSL